MVSWRDIGIKENAYDKEEEARKLASAAVQRITKLDSDGDIDLARVTDDILAHYKTFSDETKVTLRWSDVPREKQRFDYEQSLRALFIGYRRRLEVSDSDLEEMGRAGQMEFDKRFSFFHSLDIAIAFAEARHVTQKEALGFLSALMEGKVAYDPLYLREVLNNPAWLSDEREIKDIAAAIAAHRLEYHSIDAEIVREPIAQLEDEAAYAEQFFRTRPPKVVLPQKFVVHSVDGQASNKMWRTYDQVAARTADTLASIATYGIVAGGIVGGINPTTLMGTVDRADLCIINWYPKYQGAILVPLDTFARPNHEYKFTGSMSVMVDGDKAHGTDIIVGPDSDGILPEIKPSGFVAIVPAALQERVSAEMYRLGHLLGRSNADVHATLNRCIGYDPTHWKNIHHFNEWLQTTPDGNALLEERLGRRITDLPTVNDIKARQASG